MGLEPVDVVLAGGESPEDLATNVVMRFLDPNDRTVRWAPERGTPTTDGVHALLRQALRNDFLDIKKSKRYKTTVYVNNGESVDEAGKGLTLDQLAVHLETPEGKLLKKQRVEAIITEFADDPKALDILQLQLDPEGYNAFSNQELAELLDITVSEVENRKKRISNRLLRILRNQGETSHA
jgi:DNA-directed RNA polymerase specialized sigma24 family protein